MNEISRRQFIKTGLAAGTLLPVLGGTLLRPGVARAEGLVTEDPAAQAVVQALGYVHETTKADQTCGNCQLYTAGEGDTGKCTLFQSGLVKEGGWCMSWTKKVQ
jgi:hypothetical protein